MAARIEDDFMIAEYDGRVVSMKIKVLIVLIWVIWALMGGSAVASRPSPQACSPAVQGAAAICWLKATRGSAARQEPPCRHSPTAFACIEGGL